jgi:hypothetical protein
MNTLKKKKRKILESRQKDSAYENIWASMFTLLNILKIRIDCVFYLSNFLWVYLQVTQIL